MKILIAAVLSICVVGVATGNEIYGPTSASYVPPSLDLCADYGAVTTCTGRAYKMYEDDGRYVTKHEGIDFRAKPGTEVISGADGVIIGTGTGVCGGGYAILHAHLDTTDPRTNKKTDLYVLYHQSSQMCM